MSQFLIVMLVQLLLVLLCVVAGVAFLNYRRRHDEDVGAQMLVYHINSHKDLRVDSLTTLIEKVYGSQGDELKNIVDQLYLKEADCYRELIQVFMNRDPKQLTKMYDAVQKITAAYEGMLLQLNAFESKDQISPVKKIDYSDKPNFAPIPMPSSAPAAVADDAKTAPVPASAPVNPQLTAAQPALETVVTEKNPSSDTALESSSNYQKPAGISTDGLQVKMEDAELASTNTELANQPTFATDNAAVNNLAPATDANSEEAPLASTISDVLPSDQEMAYYQDKLMTYLESKEISKSSVTELLDKDNPKLVAKEE